MPSRLSRTRVHGLMLSSIALAIVIAPSSAPAGGMAEGTGESAKPFDLDAPLWEPGVLDPANGQVGRWQRELDRRSGLLASHTGKDHVAALALLGLLPSLLGEVDRATLVTFVDGIRNDKRRHPLVRALADDTRAQLHEDAGEVAEAQAVYEASGRLLSWRIIGPFDNANRSGHDNARGPELEPWAPEQSFEGNSPASRSTGGPTSPRTRWVAATSRSTSTCGPTST